MLQRRHDIQVFHLTEDHRPIVDDDRLPATELIQRRGAAMGTVGQQIRKYHNYITKYDLGVGKLPNKNVFKLL